MYICMIVHTYASIRECISYSEFSKTVKVSVARTKKVGHRSGKGKWVQIGLCYK